MNDHEHAQGSALGEPATPRAAVSRTPRCPQCGSSNVREWGLVYVGYEVVGIGEDGLIETDDSGGEVCYESYGYDHLMCRECDHQDADPGAFIARPDVILGEN